MKLIAESICLKKTENKFLYEDDSSVVPLEDKFDKSRLNNDIIVVRDEDPVSNRYCVYELNDSETGPPGDFCHEVIYGDKYQKLRFDIDAKFRSKEDCDIAETEILTYLIEAICTVWKEMYSISTGKLLDSEDIVIMTSSGKIDAGYKMSLHLLIAPTEYCVENNKEAKAFALKVKLLLPELYRSYIDEEIYKTKTNLRMLYSYKTGKIRQLILKGEYNDFRYVDSLITYTKGLTLLTKKIADQYVDADVYNEICLTSEQVKQINSLLTEDEKSSFTIRNVTTNIINFQRIRPSYCTFCERIHDHDNTLYLRCVTSSNGSIKVYKYCRKSKSDAQVVGNIENHQNVEMIKKAIEPEVVEEKVKYVLDNDEDLFNKWGIRDEYDENVMRKFVDDDKLVPRTICVKAPMRMGKTKELLRFIEERFKDENNVIRILTFRRTFASHMFQRFKNLGFDIYSDINGKLNQKRLIIQLESLHRLDIKPTDLLIMDESELIIEQMCSGLYQSFNHSLAAFIYMLENAKHVVCMDALMGDRTYRVIEKIRGTKDMLLHINRFKRDVDDKYLLATSKCDWLNYLITCLENDEKVAIMTNSLAECKTLNEFIGKSHPEKRIGVYSSETNKAEKNAAFENVDEVWSTFDILIITPTVSAGVSFERAHFDRVFGLFTNKSCPVETCIQMLGRVRNVRSNEYTIFIECNNRCFPTSIKEIKNRIYQQQMYVMTDNCNVPFKYDPEGNIVITDTFYLQILLENIRIKNLSKNNFVDRFVKLISQAGATVSLLEIDNGIQDIEDIHKSIKEEIKIREATNIATALDIDTEEFLAIKEERNNQDIDAPEIEKSRLYSYKKHAFKQYYGLGNVELDYNVILDYNNEAKKKQFVNLNIAALYKDYEVGEVLKAIRANDIDHLVHAETKVKAYNSELLSSFSKHMRDELINSFTDHARYNYNYIYIVHSKVQCIINLFGWDHILDTKDVYLSNFINTFSLNVNNIRKDVKLISYSTDCKLKLPDISSSKYATECIKYINNVISPFYNISIKMQTRKASDISRKLKLILSDEFEYNECMHKFIIPKLEYIGDSKDCIITDKIISTIELMNTLRQ